MKISGERVFLTRDEAIKAFDFEEIKVSGKDQKEIRYHIFTPTKKALLGSLHNPMEMDKILTVAESIELSGPYEKELNHGICLIKNKRLYFIKTKPEKIDEFEKQAEIMKGNNKNG